MWLEKKAWLFLVLSKNIAEKKKEMCYFAKLLLVIFFIFNACPISGLVLMLMVGI